MVKKPRNMDQFIIEGLEEVDQTKVESRASYLQDLANEVTEANKHLGAAVLSDSMAAELGINPYHNSEAYLRHYNKAKYMLRKACGVCAVRGCEKRGDFGAWEEKYHRIQKRAPFIKAVVRDANNGIERPC
jgi:hypothetical protein